MSLIFLDRDGVINEFPGKNSYVTRWEDFHFLPKAIEAIRSLKENGFEIHVVSNQGCVARGLLSLTDLEEMTSRMLKGIEKEGGKLDGVSYCIHQTSDDCNCKKPKTALFEAAARGKHVDFKSVYFIGDSEEDMEAGHNLGCKTVLVLSGRTKAADLELFHFRPDVVKNDLWEAVRWLIQEKS